jgi:hypothetical protein
MDYDFIIYDARPPKADGTEYKFKLPETTKGLKLVGGKMLINKKGEVVCYVESRGDGAYDGYTSQVPWR